MSVRSISIGMAGARPEANASTTTPEQLAACLKNLRSVRGSATLFFSTLAQVCVCEAYLK